MRMKTVLAASLLVLSQAAQAQDTYQWLLTPRADVEGGRSFYLPQGMALKLKMVTQISSRENHSGDKVYLEVAENVKFRGQTVIPIGSPAVGEVTSIERNGHLGRKGAIALRLIQVVTPGGPIRLDGDALGKGRNQTALSVGTIVLVSLWGYFIHGTSGVIPSGTPIAARLGENFRFTWFPASDSERLGEGVPARPDRDAPRTGMRDTVPVPGLP